MVGISIVGIPVGLCPYPMESMLTLQFGTEFNLECSFSRRELVWKKVLVVPCYTTW